MDYLEKANETVQRMLDIEASTDWKKAKETEHCVVYSRPSADFKGYIYKAEGQIPAAAEKVFDYMYPGVEKPLRKEWDTSVTSAEVIEKPSADVDIILSRTAPAAMGLISAREFVDLVKVVREPDRIFTAAISIDHHAAQKSKVYVRGFNYPNSLFCYRVQGEQKETRLVQYVHSDIGGMIPRSVVDGAIPSAMADSYPRLKAALAKDGA